MIDDYRDYDAVGLAELISKGDVTASDVVDSAIAVAEKLNPSLNAIVTNMYEAAREQAKTPIPGPLSGVPFLIKDLNMAVSYTQLTLMTLYPLSLSVVYVDV